jgi:histidine triad (HIT) family protein
MMSILSLARTSLGGLLIGWMFTYLSFAIPLKRLRESDTLVAFYHPHPSYPLHILLVPKRAITSLMDLSSSDANFLVDLYNTVQSLVDELGLERTGYRLVVNGGDYQQIRHLHFHLVSDDLPESM